jgi:hypothetical protein
MITWLFVKVEQREQQTTGIRRFTIVFRTREYGLDQDDSSRNGKWWILDIF